MAKKKATVPKAKASKPEAEVGDMRVQRMQIWTEGMSPTSKEDGAQILYDEPTHTLDPRNKKTWPPRDVT